MLDKTNKVEAAVRTLNVHVFSSTVVKTLILKDKFDKIRIFKQPGPFMPADLCVYCNSILKKKFDLTEYEFSEFPVEAMCKKHKGVYFVENIYPIAKIKIDDKYYLLVKNWVFRQEPDGVIVEIYLSHLSVSIYQYNVFLLNSQVFDFNEKLEHAIDLTDSIIPKEEIWTHIRNDQYMHLIKDNTDKLSYVWKVKRYSTDPVIDEDL